MTVSTELQRLLLFVCLLTQHRGGARAKQQQPPQRGKKNLSKRGGKIRHCRRVALRWKRQRPCGMKRGPGSLYGSPCLTKTICHQFSISFSLFDHFDLSRLGCDTECNTTRGGALHLLFLLREKDTVSSTLMPWSSSVQCCPWTSWSSCFAV